MANGSRIHRIVMVIRSVFINSYPAMSERPRVSQVAGEYPMWSPNGDELFYIESGEARYLVSTAVSTRDNRLEIGESKRLFPTKDYNMTPGFLIPYDVHPSDGRFLFMKTINKPAKLVVITNWFDELDRLLPH